MTSLPLVMYYMLQKLLYSKTVRYLRGLKSILNLICVHSEVRHWSKYSFFLWWCFSSSDQIIKTLIDIFYYLKMFKSIKKKNIYIYIYIYILCGFLMTINSTNPARKQERILKSVELSSEHFPGHFWNPKHH